MAGERARTFESMRDLRHRLPGKSHPVQAGVPIASTVGKFKGYNHASSYLMDEHDAALVAGFPQPPASG